MAVQGWREDAACSRIDPALWSPASYSTHDDREAVREAARVCFTSCTVRAECLAFAVAHRECDAVWGGLTPLQRVRWMKAGSDEERQAVIDTVRMLCGLPAERVA